MLQNFYTIKKCFIFSQRGNDKSSCSLHGLRRSYYEMFLEQSLSYLSEIKKTGYKFEQSY